MNYVKTLLICSCTILICGLLSKQISYLFEVYIEDKPEIGENYLISFDFYKKNNDPFEDLEIDTIIVLDYKNGYVLYDYPKYNGKLKNSIELKLFNKITKPIKN